MVGQFNRVTETECHPLGLLSSQLPLEPASQFSASFTSKCVQLHTLGLATETRLCAILAWRGCKGGTLDVLDDLEFVKPVSRETKIQGG